MNFNIRIKYFANQKVVVVAHGINNMEIDFVVSNLCHLICYTMQLALSNFLFIIHFVQFALCSLLTTT